MKYLEKPFNELPVLPDIKLKGEHIWGRPRLYKSWIKKSIVYYGIRI